MTGLTGQSCNPARTTRVEPDTSILGGPASSGYRISGAILYHDIENLSDRKRTVQDIQSNPRREAA